MSKLTEKQLQIEWWLRGAGSSGQLRGHWHLIEVIDLYLDGTTIKNAIAQVAEANGASENVVRRRIDTLIRHMQKLGAEGYLAAWPNGERPTVNNFIKRVGELI